MKLFVALLLLLVCGKWQLLQAAKILCLVGTPRHNRPEWTQPLFEALAGRGHALSVVSTANTSDYPGIRRIQLENDYDVVQKHYVENMFNYHQYWDIKQMLIWYEALLGTCRALIDSADDGPDLSTVLAELTQAYDLIIYDATYSMDCLLNLLPKYRSVPVLGLSGGKLTSDLLQLMRAENTISAARTPHFTSRLSQDMSYWQRLQNHVMYIGESFIRSAVVTPVLNGMLREGYTPPSVQLMLLNTHPVLDYVQNMPPNVIEVGGLHIRAESAPLPFIVQEFIERFAEGVVYIDLPELKLMYGLGKQAVVKMAKDYPQYGFLYNVNHARDLELTEMLHNLRTVHFDGNMKQDILAQSNIKAFFTHGDSFSLQESIFNAVPVVVLPLLMDQLNNAQRVVERFLGVRVEPEDFELDSFSSALNLIIRDDVYAEALTQAQLNFRTRQLVPLEQAVWYVEQLASEPQLFAHLTVKKPDGFFVRYSLDVLAGPILFIMFFFFNIALLIMQVVENFNKKKAKPKQKNKKEAVEEQKED